MTYNPELVKQLLGDKVAELFDGTIETSPSKNENFGNLKVGDTLTFKFKGIGKLNQFVITGTK